MEFHSVRGRLTGLLGFGFVVAGCGLEVVHTHHWLMRMLAAVLGVVDAWPTVRSPRLGMTVTPQRVRIVGLWRTVDRSTSGFSVARTRLGGVLAVFPHTKFQVSGLIWRAGLAAEVAQAMRN